MNIYALSSVMAFAISFFLSLFIYVKGTRDKRHNAIIHVILCIGLWCLFPFFAWIGWPEKSLFLTRLVYIAAIFAAPTFLRFGLTILDAEKFPKEKRLINASFFTTILVFLPFSLSPIFIRDIRKAGTYFSIAGSYLYLIFIFYFGSVCLYCFYRFYLAIKTSTGAKKNQIRYVFTGFLLAFLGGLIHFSTSFGFREFFPHDLLVVACMLVLTYSIIRHHLMDINIVFTRAAILIFVYVLVLGIPFIIAGWGKTLLVNSFGNSWFWIPLIVFFILATAGPFLFLFLRRRAEDIMLKEQRSYQRALLELSKTMTRIRDLDKLLQAIVLTVVDQVKVNFAAIYLKAPELQSYQLKHYFPKGTKARFKEFIALDDPLIGVISQRRVPLSAEEIGPQDKIELDSGLLIPCFIEDNLLGFLVLGAKPNNQMYTTDDLIVFETLSYSTSLAIENSQFWREIEDRQRKARLQEMDTYSYSLAHEIDNPMYIILGQARLLQKQVEAEQNITVVPEKKKELTDSFDFILEAARRVSGMVKAIRDFGSPTTGELQPLDLEDVVNSFFSIYLPKCKGAGVPMEKIYPAQPLWVLGEKPLLMQVMVILANNSLHAVTRAPEKKITVKVDIAREGWVRIAFTDTGYGISKELLPIIFQAFTTTKASSEGTGMGLYNAEKIVRQHKGRIWAESEGKDKGATLFVELPLTQEVLTKEQQKEKKSQVAFVSPPRNTGDGG